MAKTKIEWSDITLNPVRGKCPHGCDYCYAEGIRQRFKQPEEMSFYPEVIEQMLKLREPRTIFWGSMFDLFAGDVYTQWLHNLFQACISENGKKHTHVFLTKNPERLALYSNYKTAGNIFFGTSTTGSLAWCISNKYLDFVSVEPFISEPKAYDAILKDITEASFTHIIIGGLTGKGNPYKHTSYSSVVNLVEIAFKAGKKVFIKDNIKEYIPYPVGLGMNISADACNFRQLPWGLHTKSLTEGIE